MTRKLDSKRILIATHNAGKLEEMRQLFGPFGVEVVGAAELNLPEPDETETTIQTTEAGSNPGLSVLGGES